jgi:hypothetical protein
VVSLSLTISPSVRKMKSELMSRSMASFQQTVDKEEL